MPFVHPIVTTPGKNALVARFRSSFAAQSALEEEVAAAFREHMGEEAIVTKCSPIVVDDFMDCPLCVTIIAKYTREREPHFEDVQFGLEEKIRSWSKDLAKVEVHIVQDGSRTAAVTGIQECANCGEPGHPGHHWLGSIGYSCIHKPELTEDAPPPPGYK